MSCAGGPNFQNCPRKKLASASCRVTSNLKARNYRARSQLSAKLFVRSIGGYDQILVENKVKRTKIGFGRTFLSRTICLYATCTSTRRHVVFEKPQFVSFSRNLNSSCNMNARLAKLTKLARAFVLRDPAHGGYSHGGMGSNRRFGGCHPLATSTIVCSPGQASDFLPKPISTNAANGQLDSPHCAPAQEVRISEIFPYKKIAFRFLDH